jgi:hypothetical protein
MDARNFVNLIQADQEARRRQAWIELHRRPDAPPLPPETFVPWTQRVIVLRWLFKAAAVARRIPTGSSRGQRSDEALSG